MKNKTKYRNHIVQISKPEKEVMKTYITLWLSKWRISPSHTHTYLPRFFYEWITLLWFWMVWKKKNGMLYPKI